MGIYNEYMNRYIKPIRIALDDVGFKEKKALETCRLDLDAAKAKLKKVKTLEMRDQVENEVQAAQVSLVNYTKVTVLHMIVRVHEPSLFGTVCYRMSTRVCIQAGFMRQQELLKLLLENISSAQTTQVITLYRGYNWHLTAL